MKKLLPIVCLLAVCIASAPARSHEPAGSIQLASVNAAIADLSDGGQVLYAKNPDRVVPIASITKLMTAMVVLDSGEPLNEWLRVVEREHDPVNNGYSRIRIGSELRRADLMKLALMSSENLATHVLASHHPGGRDAFVEAMNAKARALGMTSTRFVGPSGLSPLNRSTAADLLKLVAAAMDYEHIREYTTTSYYRARFRRPRYALEYGNTNPLVASSRWDVRLSKTGYLNEAGRCLVMVARIDGRSIAMVLLDSFGTRTPLGDAGRVKRWLTIGDSGSIAAAALDYERRRNAEYEQASTLE
jgi:D-alanyl-D-alanine endopeptidase (penicillin-binding protein 7)